ncbi:MAG: hypothetical protein LC115_03090 [Bacteroidia bacterium]|nr:hypothetical protein [Bacteroidia bacterium]
MKNNLLQLTLSVSMLFFLSCQKTEPDVVKDVKFSLTSPFYAQPQNPCCISFFWQLPTAGQSILKVSPKNTFDSLIVDTTLNSPIYKYPKNLEPGKTYYWKVTWNNETKIDSFSIKNTPLKAGGVHYVEVYSYDWNSSGIYNENTKADSIFLTRNGSTIRYQYPPKTIDKNLKFSVIQQAPNKVYFLSPDDLSNLTTLEHTFSNDSFYVESKKEISGGGNVVRVRGKF